MKKNKNYFWAFFIPFIICIVLFLGEGVFSNIENVYLSDLSSQHLSFFNHLKNILTDKASIFYSFYAGMGSPMLATVIFYCLSPINLLLLAIKDIQYAIIFIYIIKISLAGLTMFLLLKNKTKHENFMTIIFSTSYALSSFAINYFICIFWFDSLYLAPLVILGIEKIFKEEKMNLLYIFSLALAIICNIQMGFGLCIFSLIYCVYMYLINYSIKNYKKVRKIGRIFLVSSLCSAAISSGVLLGFLDYYKEISLARDLSSNYAEISNLGLIMKNVLTVGNKKIGYINIDEPYIYCGLIITFFSILYLFNNKINKNKRLYALGVILIFCVSFCVDIINESWHLSPPILLNYRYSIYLSLFLTIISYENYENKKELTKREIVILIILLIIGILLTVIYRNETYIVWTIVFLLADITLILLTKNVSKSFQPFLATIIIVEVLVNSFISFYTAQDLSDYKYVSYKKFSKLENLNSDYRVIYNYSYTDFLNDSLLLNHNSSLRYFSSVINGNLINFFIKNNVETGSNNYKVSAYDSPLLLSLMGNKYFYLTEEIKTNIYSKLKTYKIKDYDFSSQTNKVNKVYLYENPYSLTLGYIIEKDVKYDNKMDSIDFQNQIIKSFTGINKDVLIRLNYKKNFSDVACINSEYIDCNSYEILNTTNNNLVYIYTILEQYTIFNDGKSYLDIKRPLLINTKDKKINLMIENLDFYEKQHLTVFTFNEKTFIENFKKLQENMLENIKITKNKLVGEIDSSKDGILFLSIPYEEKFKIYIDNKEVNYYPVLDNTFIGLDLKKGYHKIKIKYIDKNYKWYITSSIASIFITLILYYFINKKIER